MAVVELQTGLNIVKIVSAEVRVFSNRRTIRLRLQTLTDDVDNGYDGWEWVRSYWGDYELDLTYPTQLTQLLRIFFGKYQSDVVWSDQYLEGGLVDDDWNPETRRFNRKEGLVCTAILDRAVNMYVCKESWYSKKNGEVRTNMKIVGFSEKPDMILENLCETLEIRSKDRALANQARADGGEMPAPEAPKAPKEPVLPSIDVHGDANEEIAEDIPF